MAFMNFFAGLLRAARYLFRTLCGVLMPGLVLVAQAATQAMAVLPVSAPGAVPEIAVVAAVAAAPADASSVRISQAWASTPGVFVYLDIRSETSDSVADVRAGQLQAEIGPYPASTKTLQSFASSGEGVAYIFLIDVSKSLKPDQFGAIRKALLLWSEKMGVKDRAAIVTFGESVKTALDFTADKSLLKTKIEELVLTDLHTRLNEGLVRALDLGRRGDADLPQRRVIITLTDGLDDAAGGSSREDTLARIKEEPVPIYAIGFAAASVSARDRAEGFKVLGAYAQASGGAYIAADAKPLDEIYAKVHELIQAAYLLRLDCAACPGDGRAYPLCVKLQAGNRILTATRDVRLVQGVVLPVVPPAVVSAKPEQIDSLPLWIWLAGGLGLVAVLGFLLARRKKFAPVPNKVALEPLPPVHSIVPPIEDNMAATTLLKHGISLRLTAVSGAQRGREWLTQVGAETVIGRSNSCDVVIDDDSLVSSRNSILSAEGGLLFVDDLGSTNGTSVNGSPISGKRRVIEGDLIWVGRTELRLTLVESAG